MNQLEKCNVVSRCHEGHAACSLQAADLQYILLLEKIIPGVSGPVRDGGPPRDVFWPGVQ